MHRRLLLGIVVFLIKFTCSVWYDA